MRLMTFATLFAALMLAPISGEAIFGKDDPDKKREELQEARDNIEQYRPLYAPEPQSSELPSGQQ